MGYNVVFKGLALLLAAALLVVMFFCGMLILDFHSLNLYDSDLNALQEEVCFYRACTMMNTLANNYAEKHLSDCPESIWSGSNYIVNGAVLDENDILSSSVGIDRENWGYTIMDAAGNLLVQAEPENVIGWERYNFQQSGTYPALGTEQDYDYVDKSTGEILYIKQQNSPVYSITIWLAPGAVKNIAGFSIGLLTKLYDYRYTAIMALVAFAMVFLGLMTFLCCAAGRKRGLEEVRPGGLNRLPLDLYMVLAGYAATIASSLTVMLSPLYDKGWYDPVTKVSIDEPSVFETIVCAVILYGVMVIVLSFFFAFAAQVKAPKHFWWRNSLMGRVFKLTKKLLLKLFFLLRRVFRLLPLMWRWLLTGALIVACLGVSLLLRSDILIALSLLFGCAMTVYGAYAFSTILRGADRMVSGSLNTKIPEGTLWGDYRELAQKLNALSDVAVEAADARLRSERMKTELITNVSHDIKTPLTSIINYVDLMKTAEDEAARQAYLLVLDRQSLRLKKLIDDLMELSKASSGSIQANIEPVDVTEALNQALGEFSDKFQQAQLQICPTVPEEPVMIDADGRLFWRVLANLMGNVVKYAMPATRVYVNLERNGNTAEVSIRNISREPLNISAQELMERFVRGDASRNTEGSGLGLSIAGSLMEVQKGDLQLCIDGDLFKVTLTFPLSKNQG